MQSVLGMAVTVLITVGLMWWYFGSVLGSGLRDGQVSAATAELTVLASAIAEDPSLLDDQRRPPGSNRLQAMIDQLPSNLGRISAVNDRLYVAADTDHSRRGTLTDQTGIIVAMGEAPGDHLVPATAAYTRDGRNYKRLTVSIHGSADPASQRRALGALSIELPTWQLDAQVRAALMQAALWLLLASLILAGVQIVWLQTSVLAPARRLRHAAEALTGEDSGALVAATGGGEMAGIGLAFNAMAQRLRQTATALRGHADRVEAVFRFSPLAILELDLERNVSMWNPAAERLFGWNAAEALGRPFRAIPPEAEAQVQSDALFESLEQGLSVADIEVQRVHKDGGRLDVRVSAAPLHGTDGQTSGFVFVFADISQIKRAEAVAEESRAALAATVASLEAQAHALRLVNELGDTLHACTTVAEAGAAASRAIERIHPVEPGVLFLIPPSHDGLEPAIAWGPPGIDPQRFSGDSCWAVRRGRRYQVEDPAMDHVCPHVAEQPDGPYPYVCWPLFAQGEALGIIHMRAVAGSPAFSEGSAQFLGAAVDQVALAISNLRLRDTLRRQSIGDVLTGLFNRRYLEETLPREIARATRAGTSVSAIMIDVDHFKRFNDSHGHLAGDAALRAVGACLRTYARFDDIACRYGGEEFALVLPGATLEVAHKRAEQVRAAVRALPLALGDQPLGTITVSLGVATFPEHGETGAAILKSADAALYRAKESGRDRVEVARLSVEDSSPGTMKDRTDPVDPAA